MVNQTGKGMVAQLLAQSLKELAAKQPFDKITIKAITDRAGVIRPTFYHHFQDKYELLEWIVKTEILEPTRPLLLSGMPDQMLLLIFTRMKQDQEFYCKIAKTDDQNSFSDIVKHCVQDVLEEVFGSRLKKISQHSQWLTPKHLAEFYAQTMCYIVMEWLRGDMAIDAKEMTDIYMYMMQHSIADVLESKDGDTN